MTNKTMFIFLSFVSVVWCLALDASDRTSVLRHELLVNWVDNKNQEREKEAFRKHVFERAHINYSMAKAQGEDQGFIQSKYFYWAAEILLVLDKMPAGANKTAYMIFSDAADVCPERSKVYLSKANECLTAILAESSTSSGSALISKL